MWLVVMDPVRHVSVVLDWSTSCASTAKWNGSVHAVLTDGIDQLLADN